jgi:hypothetical protein
MHPLLMLQEIVEALGAKLVERDYRADAFGSGVVVFSMNERSLRLVWDGRDGWGFFQVRSPVSGEWIEASPVLTEGDLEDVPQNHAKIELFKQAAAAALAAGAG